MSEPIRVLVVDDHVFYREGIKTLLAARASEVEVVGEAGSGEEAIEQVGALSPDVVLMDLRMAGMGGLAATREIAGRTAVLVLTMLEDDTVVPALRAGARGYLLKDAGVDDLVRAVQAVHGGQSVLAPQAAAWVQRQLDAPRHSARPFPELTDREHDMLAEIVRGRSTVQIARTRPEREDGAQLHRDHAGQAARTRPGPADRAGPGGRLSRPLKPSANGPAPAPGPTLSRAGRPDRCGARSPRAGPGPGHRACAAAGSRRCVPSRG